MILSFGWTTPALVLREKTRTRRDHSPKTVAQLTRCCERGDLVDAWNTTPRNNRAVPPPGKIATIRLTEAPFYETAPPPSEDWRREGFHVLQAIGHKLNGHSPLALWRHWQTPRYYLASEPTIVYSFEVVELTPFGEQLALEARERYEAAIAAGFLP